jgi:hypothetical protein
MRRAILFATTTVAAMLFTLTLGVSARQLETHDKTFLTFSGAVELPGMRLEPGTYVFRIADTPSRNVIQVLSKDEKGVMGQWLFIPAQRLEVTDDTVITFKETSAGSTPAVQYWYYPGEKIGKEFIYPKDQAMRIARRTGGTVLTEEGRVSAEGVQTSASIDTTADYQPSTVQASAGPQLAPAQEQGAVAVGTAGTAQSRQDVRQESTGAGNELPRTASPLPLSGLISLLSLAGAAGIRRFRL